MSHAQTAGDSRQLLLDWGEETHPPTQDNTWNNAGNQTAPTTPSGPEKTPPLPPATRPLLDAPAAPTAPPAMQHPQANRHIVLERCALAYLLQRSRRRTVGMRIDPAGLVVSAPAWVNQAEIERILHTKARWIVEKLQEQARKSTEQQLCRPVWQHGMVLPWRGGLLQIHLTGADANPAAASKPLGAAHMRRLAASAMVLQDASLPPAAPALASHGPVARAPSAVHIALPRTAAADTLRCAIGYWMQQQATAIFTQRLNHYAPLLGVCWQSLALSNAQGRWGSATSRGAIRLHWRLVQMPPEVLDYVVVHELSHLHEMNHGPRFWAWVEKILPDYRQRQFLLKKTVLAPW